MWSHLVLGFCLGMSPAAAWIAIAGSLDKRMLILCAAVTLWVGGFDVLYACQDVDFDRAAGLYSVPRRFGIARSLLIARAMHVVMTALLLWLAASFRLPWPAWMGIAVVAALLAYEHTLVRANDLRRLNAAFFTVNGYISLLFLLFWSAAVAMALILNSGGAGHRAARLALRLQRCCGSEAVAAPKPLRCARRCAVKAIVVQKPLRRTCCGAEAVAFRQIAEPRDELNGREPCPTLSRTISRTTPQARPRLQPRRPQPRRPMQPPPIPWLNW